MDTAHKTNEEKKEYFDSEQELDQKVTQLAEWVKASRHFTVFTGAGISTSAGIPDYRSGVNTVLPTGPGAWERLATKTATTKAAVRKAMITAMPTRSHMAMARLMEAGYLKFVVSQNVDGLHRKSGIPAKKIAEVHGNTNVEVCKNKTCKKRYLRDFRTRTSKKVHDHKTGRKCENCGQDLHDTIVNFGEHLPEWELETGFEEAAKSDLCLVLGSSLRIPPAAHMPVETVKKGGRLVIVNLQSTPLDEIGFRINGLIDDVMVRLMKKLELEIPPFTLKRRMMVMKSDIDPKKPGQKGKTGLIVRGVDEEGSPYSLFKSVRTVFAATKEAIVQDKEPVRVYSVRSDIARGIVKFELTFQGHYKEPVLDVGVDLELLKMNEAVYYFMEYDPQVKKWISCKQTLL